MEDRIETSAVSRSLYIQTSNVVYCFVDLFKLYEMKYKVEEISYKINWKLQAPPTLYRCRCNNASPVKVRQLAEGDQIFVSVYVGFIFSQQTVTFSDL